MTSSAPEKRWNPLQRFWSRAPQRERTSAEDFWTSPTMVEDFPTLDVKEDENEVRITAEMPGLEKDDFKVEVTGNRLMIRGEKKESREEKEKDYYYSECSYGSFSRAVTLPCEVDSGKAEAEYKNGVLNLRLPKTESARARQITVNVRS